MASIVNFVDKRPAFDVGLVVNLHRARPYLARTVLSIEEAVLFAQAEGVRIQLVLVLDRPDGATSDWISRYDWSAFEGHEIITVDYGSLGPARNDGLRAARGEFVMLLDDDDLISFNLIVECLRIARKEGPRCIVIPQYVVNFGPGSLLAKYSGSDDISPLALISDHPYVSRIFAHSSIRDALSFAVRSARRRLRLRGLALQRDGLRARRPILAPRATPSCFIGSARMDSVDWPESNF